jgi:hypothetical protein
MAEPQKLDCEHDFRVHSSQGTNRGSVAFDEKGVITSTCRHDFVLGGSVMPAGEQYRLVASVLGEVAKRFGIPLHIMFDVICKVSSINVMATTLDIICSVIISFMGCHSVR